VQDKAAAVQEKTAAAQENVAAVDASDINSFAVQKAPAKQAVRMNEEELRQVQRVLCSNLFETATSCATQDTLRWLNDIFNTHGAVAKA
jgi:chemotaxis methyl-accepting protein methylase